VTEIYPWIKRKFDFDFPTTFYPSFCIRLRGAPARLEELVRGLPAERLISKPSDKWSIQEIAGHLVDAETLWVKRLDEFIEGAKTLTAADMSNRQTFQADHNSRKINEILDAFRTSRISWVNRLDRLDSEYFGREAHHPRLDVSMRLVDLLQFVAEHDDHHLARIWELRANNKEFIH
jgi:uncharacterized damage-inducible protein DinB